MDLLLSLIAFCICISATYSYSLQGAADTKDRRLPNLSTQKSAKQPVVLDSLENLPRVQSITRIIPQNLSRYNGALWSYSKQSLSILPVLTQDFVEQNPCCH